MRYFGLVFLLSLNFLHAETYVYRLEKDKNTPQAVKSFVSAVETKGNQPYINTSVVEVSDKYSMIFFTPNDRQDFELEAKLLGVELYKIIALNQDGFFYSVLDNSSIYPVFEVPISSK